MFLFIVLKPFLWHCIFCLYFFIEKLPSSVTYTSLTRFLHVKHVEMVLASVLQHSTVVAILQSMQWSRDIIRLLVKSNPKSLFLQTGGCRYIVETDTLQTDTFLKDIFKIQHFGAHFRQVIKCFFGLKQFLTELYFLSFLIHRKITRQCYLHWPYFLFPSHAIITGYNQTTGNFQLQKFCSLDWCVQRHCLEGHIID